MDRIAELEADGKAADAGKDDGRPASPAGDWGQHPINLRVTLPFPFRRWYVTLVAGPERRSADRLRKERTKHPLETGPNLLFLLSIGIVGSTLFLLIAALILIHGFGWSIQLMIPA